MRRLITWGTKEVSGIITWETRVTILEMQVGTTKEKDSMIGQQTESRETGRKEMGTEMIAVERLELSIVGIGCRQIFTSSPRVVVSFTGNFTAHQSQHKPKEAFGNCKKKVHDPSRLLRTVKPLVNPRYYGSLKKKCNSTSSPTASQSKSLDYLWGELPKRKSGKRKKNDGESDDELSADLSREKRRQQKKDHRASRKEAREKEALEQQWRDAVLAGASGSGAHVLVSGSQPDPELVSESAPIDRGQR
uniref:Uncharacterized protein n=1 Tax=Solanum tuberosum TaxID=4113 RepID=M1D9P4_SOLTU